MSECNREGRREGGEGLREEEEEGEEREGGRRKEKKE